MNDARPSGSDRPSTKPAPRGGLLRVILLLLVMGAGEPAVAARLALPQGLQQTALLCLAEAQRLCPTMLGDKDHGVVCLVAKRRQLSQTCRTVADQAVSLLHGGDVHLDLRALRRHLPRPAPAPKPRGVE